MHSKQLIPLLMVVTGLLLASNARVALAAATASSPASDPLTLDTAVQIAMDNNPGLAAKRAQAQAMAAIPDQVGALPDPRLMLNAMNVPVDTYALDQEPMTQMQIGLSQAFPFPGKLGLREVAAREMALAAGEDVEEARLHLIANVKATWWRLHFLDRALEIVVRNQQLLRQFVKIAETKYKVGKGLQQDVLLAQLELSKLLDRQVQLRQKRRIAEARLNALLNRPTETVGHLPLITDIRLKNIPPLTRLTGLAAKHRPLLARQRNQVKSARARLDLANKGYYPDFKLSAVYGSRQAKRSDGSEVPDFATIMLSLNLPLYAGRKQSQAINQRSAELIKQQQGFRSIADQVAAAISRYSADYNSATERVELFKHGIIPQARQTVSSMLAGYQVNKVDFLNLVRVQITLYKYETQYWMAVSDAQRALAQLTAAVGKETIYE